MPPGDKLPGEIIALIALSARNNTPTSRESDQPKRHLASLSVVCRAWCAVLSPRLFSPLTLRDPSDLAFLRTIVERRQATCPIEAVQVVDFNLSSKDARPWVCQLHWLSTRFPQASLILRISGAPPQSLRSIHENHWLPAFYLPLAGLPQSYIRLTELELDDWYGSARTFFRFVSRFPSLKSLHCHRLISSRNDPFPLAYAPRLRHFRLKSCRFHSAGSSFEEYFRLAVLLLGLPGSGQLDARLWLEVVDAMVAFLLRHMPGRFGVSVSRNQSLDATEEAVRISIDGDSGMMHVPTPYGITVDICIRTSTTARPRISDIAMLLGRNRRTRFNALGYSRAALPATWDTLAPVLSSPLVDNLSLLTHSTIWPQLLESTLEQGRVPRWVLETGKFMFRQQQNRFPDGILATGTDILNIPETLIRDGCIVALSSKMRAQYLIHHRVDALVGDGEGHPVNRKARSGSYDVDSIYRAFFEDFQ